MNGSTDIFKYDIFYDDINIIEKRYHPMYFKSVKCSRKTNHKVCFGYHNE